MTTLLEAFALFQSDPSVRSTVRSPRSWVSYRETIGRLDRWVDGTPVELVAEADLLGFLGRPGLAPLSVRALRSRLQRFFRWAARAGLCATDPAANLSELIQPKARGVKTHHWLSEDQVKALVGSSRSPRDSIVLLLGLFTGLRAAELVAVTWDRVDLQAGTLVLVGKGEKPAWIGLAPQLTAALSEWRGLYEAGLGRPVTVDPVLVRVREVRDWGSDHRQSRVCWGERLSVAGLRRVVHACGARVGLPGLAPHDLRRTFAGLLEAKSVPIQDISAALRHSDLGTTQRYLEDSPHRAISTGQAFTLNLS